MTEAKIRSKITPSQRQQQSREEPEVLSCFEVALNNKAEKCINQLSIYLGQPSPFLPAASVCLLPAVISCSVHAVPVDLLAPSEQPGSREVQVEQVSRQLCTFTPALGSGRRASLSVTGAKSILENPIKPVSVG